MAEFPFDSHRIAVLTIESPTKALKQRLLSHGYRFTCWAGSTKSPNVLKNEELWIHPQLVSRQRVRGLDYACRVL